jgi:hypothetical protein
MLMKYWFVTEKLTTCDGFTSVPEWVELYLRRKTDSAWWCHYSGFVDNRQIAELTDSYDLEFEEIKDSSRVDLNQKLRSACDLEEAKKLLREAGVICAVPDPIITPDCVGGRRADSETATS